MTNAERLLNTDHHCEPTVAHLDSFPERPKTILFVSPVAERGGAETVLLTLVRGLDRTRFRPLVVFLKDGPFAEEVASAGVETVVIPTGRARYLPATLRAIGAIRRLIRERQAKLVFGNMAMGHLYGGLAALGTAAKAVWFQHGIPTRRETLTWLAAAIPARIIYAPSERVKSFQASIWPWRQIERIDLGVDHERFDPCRYSFGAIRREFSIARDAPMMVMLGRFQHGKGQHIFIEAAALVLKKIPEAYFLIVGDSLFALEPDYGSAIRRRANDAGLGGRVIFAGFRHDVPEILRDTDVLVLASILPEGSPMVLIEAMAMGVPVVATSVGGVPEIVVNSVTGILVPPGDPNAIAEGIVELLSNASRKAMMGDSARRRAHAQYGARAMTERIERSLLHLLNRDSR